MIGFCSQIGGAEHLQIKELIEQEIEKAREEGKQNGWKECEMFTDGEKEVTLEALYSWRNHVRRMLSEHHNESILRNGYCEDIESAYKKFIDLVG